MLRLLVVLAALATIAPGCGFYAYDVADRDASADAGVDAGFDAGFDSGFDAGVPCNQAGSCGIFVTSVGTSDGAFGGVAGADAICATRAATAGLGGTWRAWLSDSTSCACNRLVHASVPYRLPNGTRVADDWADLTKGTLQHAIDVNENGVVEASVVEVWTGTTATGGYSGASCGDWTNATASSPFATVGVSDAASWSDVYLQFCDRTGLRFYCVEQ